VPRGDFNEAYSLQTESNLPENETDFRQLDAKDAAYCASSAPTAETTLLHPHLPACAECQMRWEFAVETVLKNFPHLIRQFIAALSVCAVLAIKGPWKPLALFFEGLSGAGKTLALNCIDGVASDEVRKSLYRSDQFTRASFVSQAASVDRKKLDQVDLLPRIRHKVLITPEMGPMFRGKKEALEETFAIIARVMDGHGLTLDSGTHGKRGYEGEHPFCWLGATTYLPKTTFEAMSNVGNRIFFYDTAPPRPTVEELAAFARKGGSTASEEECTFACECLLHHLYTEHIDRQTLSGCLEKPLMPDFVSRYLAVAARTISRLRRTKDGGEYEFRLVEQLSLLASGRAVIAGDRKMTPVHLEVIKHVTFSAASYELRPILSALFDSHKGHQITVAEVETVCLCAKETALNRMKQLKSIGICKYTEGKAPKKPSTIELVEPFALLATGGES
jgi:hypothetical protein